MELASIVLPTLNSVKHLEECICSCLVQTYPHIEVVVVDGGSTDGTLELLAKQPDCRLSLIHQPGNVGRLPGALNVGFAHTHGQYLTWMQSDCVYSPDAIAAMVDHLDAHPDIDFVYAPYWEEDEKSGISRLVRVGPTAEIMDHNVIGPCFLYRRRVYQRTGQYNWDAYLAEDYEYWLRVVSRFRMVPMDTPHFRYRIHSGCLTCQPGVIHGRWRLATRFKREHFGWPWHRYWLEMAKIDVDEAFLHYRERNYGRVASLGIKGIARNPFWITNRGLVSIIVRSLLQRQTACPK